MRILFLINDIGRGGAEVLVRNAALALASRGHSVSVGVLMRFLDFREELEQAGVTTFELLMHKGEPALGAIADLRRNLHLFRPDVVHSHLFAANLLARIAVAPERIARQSHPRVVATVHSDHEPWSRYLAYRVTAGLCDAMSFVSVPSMQHHEQGGALKRGGATLLANGVDTAAFVSDARTRSEARRRLGIASNQFLWVAVGSFRTEQKDYSVLLSALAAVGSDSQLAIAGEGALLEEKRRYAADIGISHRARFLGLWSNMPMLFAAADGFVMASRFECMPVALLEAAASGLPCVATDVGDCRRAIVEGVTGYLVPPHSPRSLAAALMRVEAMSVQARSMMGEAGRRLVVSQFSLDKMLSQWTELYVPARPTASRTDQS